MSEAEKLNKAFYDLVQHIYSCILPFVWRRETSNPTAEGHDSWSREDPARGQSAVTALLIQTHLGGNLLMTSVNERHFYNRLPDGRVLDFVRPLRDGAAHPDTTVVDREFLLASEIEVLARFQMLLDRFQDVRRALLAHTQFREPTA